MTFRVGQKVVCIREGRRSLGYGDEQYPTKGQVYTIRGFSSIVPLGSQEPMIWLEEIRNEPREYLEGFVEPPFGVSRFRPLIERKTDISIFKRMLTPKKTRVKA